MRNLLLPTLLLAALRLTAGQPAIGEAAPDFELRSLSGEPIKLSNEIAKGPVVLLALRGFPGYQCPICNRQVRDFLAKADEFAKAGARVVMVYPGPAAGLDGRAKEFTADKTFPDHLKLVLDPDYKFTNLYGLRWDAPRETAYPSTFLINTKGTVFFRKVSDSHGGRTSAAEVLDLIGKDAAK